MKRLIWIMAILGLMFQLGCGTRKSETGREVITLTLVCEPNPIREKQVRLFEEKYPHVRIKMDVVSSGMVQKILTMIAGGSAPDVFFTMDTTLLSFIRKGVVEDLGPFIEKDDDFNLQDYFPELVKTYSFQDRIYGLPGNFTPFVLYYNKNLFDKAGLDYPDETWSWADLLENAKRLTRKDEKGRIEQFGLYVLDPWEVFIAQNGGRIFNEDGSKCVINNVDVLEAIRFYYELVNVHKVCVPAAVEAQMGGTQGMQLFSMQKTAMHVSGRWHTLTFREAKGLNFRIAPLFHGKKKATRFVSMGWVMSADSKNKEVAWEFIKFLSGVESSRLVVINGDGVPPLISMVNSDTFLHDPHYPDEDNQVYQKSMLYAYPSLAINPYIPTDRVYDIMVREQEVYMLDQQSAEETLEKIEKELNRLIEEEKR